MDEFPDFFTRTPLIRVRDPLADFLGAARGGLLEYRYADAVRLAGHSCPTVASAYLMAHMALGRLYGGELPCRGEIGVSCRGTRDEGVTGVMAAVFTLLTGAADEGGFRGLGGRHGRRALLRFGADIGGEFRLTRLDTRAAVEVSAYPGRVPGDPRLGALLPLCLGGSADGAQAELFRRLWQERVAQIFERAGSDPDLIVVGPVICA